MWIIVVSKDLVEQRDDRISELIGKSVIYNYLSKRSGKNSKYYATSALSNSLIFKTESGAKKIIKEFNSFTPGQKAWFTNKFNWIRDSQLSVRKLTFEEWNKLIDLELQMLENRYASQRSKILNKRNSYK
ncbi:hypothetical protein EBU94_06660 [bacterium]|nr:hypothetical protein [bacterium]